MTLEQWLAIATRGLAQDSIRTVRAEIAEHAVAARDQGDDAVLALGDPRAANRAYRKVLLTAYEERYLTRVAGAEAPLGRRYACLITLVATAGLAFNVGRNPQAVFLSVALVVASAPPNLLPDWDPSSARFVRWVRWLAWCLCAGLLSRPSFSAGITGLALVLLLMTARMELTRANIRRKLPRSRWPERIAS